MSESEQHVRPSPPPVGQLTQRDVDVTALVTLFSSMLNTTKNDIIDQIRANSEAATGRWQLHEQEHIELLQRLDLHLEDADSHWRKYNGYLAEEHDSDVAFNARVRPVRNLVGWLTDHWKDVALLGMAILGAAGLITERLGLWR